MSEPILSDDLDYVQDCRALLGREKMRWANTLLWLTLAFVAAGVIWASRAELDEVTRGAGRVIPSSSVQIIESLEGGLLEAILVKEGDVVQPGDVLLKIHDIQYAATFNENLSRRDVLLARMARLRAESLGREDIEFPPEIVQSRPDLAASEEELFAKRRGDLETALATTRRSLELAEEEMTMTEPLLKNGIVSRIEGLRLERQINELKGSIDNRSSLFQKEALEDHDAANAELAGLGELIKGYEDRVDRTVVRSPVRGTINKIHINTVGRVIPSGQPIMEVVPLDDTLLVQANIRPSDIAFLRPGQQAVVKVTAYDYAIYGALDGEVEHIGADTTIDERGERFYQIKVRTNESSLRGAGGEAFPIMPGMVTEIDVVTGKKTVLQYLLKPINRARQRAFRER